MVTLAMKYFRARLQKSGRTYYYFDAGAKEIPLGADYVTAVQKWQELSGTDKTDVGTFDALADRYDTDVLPTLSKASQRVYASDLKHLRTFFKGAPLNQVRPIHVTQLLEWKKSQPTTANRLKRLASSMFNQARAWGHMDIPNPTTGVKALTVKVVVRNIKTEVYAAIWQHASQPLRDAMDLAYLTGQRPADCLKMSERDIIDGAIEVKQNKTDIPLRIEIVGELEALLKQIATRKAGYKVQCFNLVINAHGMPITEAMRRKALEKAKKLAIAEFPALATEIKKFWFTKLRSKAATDINKSRGLQAASDLLGHTTERTTQKHYIEFEAKRVKPTR